MTVTTPIITNNLSMKEENTNQVPEQLKNQKHNNSQELQQPKSLYKPGTSLEQKPVRSKRLFVGNVAKSVDQMKFREHFEKFGELKDVVLMKHRDEIQHRSFGFVHFEDEADADRVLAMEHNLEGRTLNINNATKRTKKFYVGLLSSKTTQKSMRKYFEKFGEIDDIVIFQDRGFGFVTMVQEDDNLRELEEREFHKIDNKSCKVNIAKPNNFAGRGRGGYHKGYDQGPYGHGGAYGLGFDAGFRLALARSPRSSRYGYGRGAYGYGGGYGSYSRGGYGGYRPY